MCKRPLANTYKKHVLIAWWVAAEQTFKSNAVNRERLKKKNLCFLMPGMKQLPWCYFFF